MDSTHPDPINFRDRCSSQDGLFKPEVLPSGGDVNMKPISLLGVLLIVVGALILAYQGINYTRQKDVLDVGSVHLTTRTQERIPLPPILGGFALAGGVVLLVIGARKKS